MDNHQLQPVMSVAPIVMAAGNILYQRREDFQIFSNNLFGKRHKIVITGLPGVGKTVLSNYLTGAAYKQEYTSPLTASTDLEVTRMDILNRKDKIDLNVIPGQDSPVRREALQKINQSSIDLMIYVVANGMFRLSTDSQLLRTAQRKSLQDHQREGFDEEIEALDETCELIRTSYYKHHRAQQLLVVFTKVDLYHDSIEIVRDRYSTQGKSKFSKRINTLRDQIGSDNFSWDTLPFCGRLDNFTFDGKVSYKPQLSEDQRNKYVCPVREKLVEIVM
jgi:GTPase SAR1 family protein